MVFKAILLPRLPKLSGLLNSIGWATWVIWPLIKIMILHESVLICLSYNTGVKFYYVHPRKSSVIMKQGLNKAVLTSSLSHLTQFNLCGVDAPLIEASTDKLL